jgi:glycosyltransferase involved in cell wall biosynthesis
MPSLVEGFGQVYLESLAHGCPVIGTPNTCLPDLGGEESGIFITAVGDVDALAARLEFLGRDLPGNPGIRASARSMARRWTWARFRQEVVAAIEAPCDDAPAAFH